jgi:hypothetical protein
MYFHIGVIGIGYHSSFLRESEDVLRPFGVGAHDTIAGFIDQFVGHSRHILAYPFFVSVRQ